MKAGAGECAVRLRGVERAELEALYGIRSDAECCRLAMVRPQSREAFFAHWDRIMGDAGVVARLIVCDGVVVGDISVFKAEGMDWVGYWIARAYWGRGIATRGLALLLDEVRTRPLHARVASTNLGSIRVLERCGFVHQSSFEDEGSERYIACEVAEYRLD